MKTKIFEGKNYKEALNACLKEGYMPATAEQVHKLLDNKKIPNNWYDTSTFYSNGKLMNATKNQLKEVNKLFKKGWRLWCVGRLYGESDAGGGTDLGDDDGRLVGVKK